MSRKPYKPVKMYDRFLKALNKIDSVSVALKHSKPITDDPEDYRHFLSAVKYETKWLEADRRLAFWRAVISRHAGTELTVEETDLYLLKMVSCPDCEGTGTDGYDRDQSHCMTCDGSGYR